MKKEKEMETTQHSLTPRNYEETLRDITQAS